MLRDNKLRPLNSDPCLPMLSERAANPSDLPNTKMTHRRHLHFTNMQPFLLIGSPSVRRLVYLFLVFYLYGHYGHIASDKGASFYLWKGCAIFRY